MRHSLHIFACLNLEMLPTCHTCVACMWVICASHTPLGLPPCQCVFVVLKISVPVWHTAPLVLKLRPFVRGSPTPFHLLPPCPRFLRYNKQASHSSRHHLLVQVREARSSATRLPEECSSRKGTLHHITSVTTSPSLLTISGPLLVCGSSVRVQHLWECHRACSVIHIITRLVYLFCARLEYCTPSPQALALCLS